MRSGFSKILVALLLALVAAGVCADADKEHAADQAAGKWLALVDAADYDESWRRAASLFKRQISPAQWQSAIDAARAPLGNMLSRELISASYATSLPGAPDGEYVVLQYRSEFKNKKNAIETVTPMFDGGRWRVSGYYIR